MSPAVHDATAERLAVTPREPTVLRFPLTPMAELFIRDQHSDYVYCCPCGYLSNPTENLSKTQQTECPWCADRDRVARLRAELTRSL